MSDVLEWAEKAGAENIKYRLQCCDSLAKDASTMLTILLAGVGGALATVAKCFDSAGTPMPIIFGSAVLAVWFMVLAAALIHYCVRTSPVPVPTNEPENLFQPEYALDDLRKVELENLQIRINEVTARNIRVAVSMDRIRYLAAASPIPFIASALVVVYWPALFALV